jgi:DNA-binding beta-propeller fold protein YncE
MHDCNKTPCHDPCPECGFGPFTRNHYFTGKLLVERDFKDEQKYYVDKLRHHDQTLHGWGVVCGLKVTPHENPACRTRYVCVEAGTAIDCCGREIVVRERDCIDVTNLPAYQPLATEPAGKSHRLQVCIRYRECPTEEIPVLYDECGCDDTRCAPNRILESYAVDLLIDQPLPVADRNAPALSWTNSVNIAHASQAVLHSGTQRLYVMNSDGTVFPVRTDNHSVLTPLTLPSPGLAIAVANDGTRLYVAVGPGDRQVLVFDTSNFAAGPIQTLPAASSAGSDIELAVAPATGRLIALLSAPGRVLAWQTDINNAGPFTAPDDITLSPTLRSLAISSDGKSAYAVDPPNHRIQIADLVAKAAGAPITVPPGTLDVFAMAIVRTTAPDVFAVVAKTDKKIVVFSSTAGNHPTTLANTPEDLVISTDGNWAYVLERNAAQSFLEIVNIPRLLLDDPVTPPPSFQIGDNATSLVITASGDRLYVPWVGNTAVAGDGAVAIVDIKDTRCTDVFSCGCHSCDEPNCLVLATIENYTVGDSFEAVTDPPSDPLKDTAAGIARIDNRLGRRLLPSTQALVQAIECVLANSGAVPGPPGPPGKPGNDGRDGANGTNGTNGTDGKDGRDGLGLNPDLPKIIDIAWAHNKTIPFDDWLASSFYASHPKELLKNDRSPLLTIYFNQDMNADTINRQTFRVSIEYPYVINKELFSGFYNFAKSDFYGYILPLGPKTTPHTAEAAKSAFAFVPYREGFQTLLASAGDVWQGERLSRYTGDLKLDPPVVRIVLKGDFIFAGATFAENGVLDAENIGGNVGLNIVRGGPIHGGKNPSGNLDQGGDFESWFYVSDPDVAGLNGQLFPLILGTAPIDLNQVPADQLDKLPGISADVAKKVADARVSGPFKSAQDLQKRAGLSDDEMAQFQALVKVRAPRGGNK